MFRLRHALALIAVAAAVVLTVSVASLAERQQQHDESQAERSDLLADAYATGDFSQWRYVQNRAYNGSGKDYVPSYPATIVQDMAKGNVARFEVRAGNAPLARGC